MSGISEKLKSLHLSADPFADNTPLANLFPGGKRRQVVEQTLALAAESTDIIAVVGAFGSGKSTLADFVTRQASQHHAVARVRASLLTSPVQLLQEMFKAFVLNFPPQSTLADLQDDLDDYLDRLAEQGRKAVLVVDDAHELGDEALSLLVRTSLDDNPANTFRLILFGEGALVDMLDYTCPLRDNQPPFQVLQLAAFSTEESSHYLRFRLNNVGFQQHDGVPALPFDRRQIQRIHKQGGGLPGPINAAASQLLNTPDGLAASLQKWLPDNLWGALRDKLPRALPGHLLGGLQDKLPDVAGKYVAAAVAVVLVVLSLALLPGGGEPGVETTQRTVSLPVPLNTTPRDTLPTAGGIERPTPPRPVAAPTVSEAEMPVSSITPLDIEPAPAQDTVAAVSQAPAPVQEPVQAPAPAVSTPARPVAPAASSAPAQARAPTAVAAPTPAATPAATDTLAAQKSRIQALAADNFTLQLLGSSSRDNVEALVARHASEALYWYETSRQQRPWYVVIHGAYPSRSAAQSAVAGLPAALREQQPWIRSIGDVQRESVAGN